jgi:RHS repeat-associated protein
METAAACRRKVIMPSSGFEQVGNTDVYSTHTRSNLTLTKNGYLYIYVSNETPNIDVFFDNLTVTHIRGPILEETHYYPFGLTMSGISSKALAFGNPENKMNKFQNQEFNNDLNINTYEFKWRTDDPQIGRFWQIDPLADKYRYNSTYAFSENKVIAHREMEGLEAWTVNNSDGTTSTFRGPWANQQSAQQAYNNRKRINGITLNIGSDGMISSTKITQNRLLKAQETGVLKNVEGIVLHRTAGSNVSGAIEGMTSRGLGVHFIIDKDGTITQLASLNFWLSHVGSPKHSNWIFRSSNTIGIEIVGRHDANTETWEDLTEEQIDASAFLVKSLMRTYSVHPYDVRNHEDLRSGKQANEGNMTRNLILQYIYTVNQDQNSDSNNNDQPMRCPVFF